jgi:hypothetical protein
MPKPWLLLLLTGILAGKGAEPADLLTALTGSGSTREKANKKVARYIAEGQAGN